MPKEIVCNHCGKVFFVDDDLIFPADGSSEGDVIVTCPFCESRVKRNFDDWMEVYYEEIHKPLLKLPKGEKNDRTHSRMRRLMARIAKERRKWWI